MLWNRLTGETRGRLLVLLRRGRHTIMELAAAVGVSDNAVRMHMAALERDGLVEVAGTRRETGGKPARLYGLTPSGEGLFPKAYAVVLNGLLSELVSQEGEERVVALLRDVGRGAARAEGPAGAGLEARVVAAAEALRGLGGEVDVERTAEGWRLCGYGCPLSDVVSEHAVACALAEALVAEITGRPVRERCERGERPRCRFEVAGSG